MVLRVKANEARKQEQKLTEKDEDKNEDEPAVKPRKPRGKPKNAKSPASKDQPTSGTNPVTTAQPAVGTEPAATTQPALEGEPVAAPESVPRTLQDQNNDADGEEIDLDLSSGILDMTMGSVAPDLSSMFLDSNKAGSTNEDAGKSL
jgi:hypothetical protein